MSLHEAALEETEHLECVEGYRVDELIEIIESVG
jgi:hypothetical protein